jgi:D-lactate dehydrogenase
MDDVKVAFFDAKSYDRDFFNQANEQYQYNIKYFREHLNSDTVALAKEAKVVCAFVNDQLNKKVVQKLADNGVELIAMRCAGYNNVDLKAVYKKIHVVRVPAYSPYAVAEHALCLMMALNRKIHKAYYRTRDSNFRIDGLVGFDMHGKNIGVIGTGKIGKCLLSIARGMGMNLFAFDPNPDKEFAKNTGVNYVALDELYKKSDVISLHCPLTPKTQHIINADSIDKMKQGVIIVNTGRGKLIDTKALIEGLKSKKIGSAGLDVYEEESNYFFEDFSNSMISDDVLARLLTFPNVIVTSHQGFFTKEALSNIAHTTLSNIKEYIEGKYLTNEICYRCEHKPCNRKQGKRCF